VKVETSSGQFQLEAFKSINSDRILRDLQKAGQLTTSRMTTSQLSWVSVGVPLLYETPAKGNANVSRLFHFTKFGFYTHIQMLSPAHSKLLATIASRKYNVSVEGDQIVHLVLSSFECSLLLHDDADNTYLLKGQVTTFCNFPLRMDFKAPRNSVERKLFHEQFTESQNENDLHLVCSMASKGKHVKTNTLTITSHEIEQLGLEKLFGQAQSSNSSSFVYVTRDQMISLAADMYSTLNIIEDFQMPETQFSEAFVEGLIGHFASRQFAHVPISKSLKAISACGLDIRGDLRADEIQRDLGEILKIENFNNRSKIVFDNANIEQYDENFKLSSSLSAKA